MEGADAMAGALRFWMAAIGAVAAGTVAMAFTAAASPPAPARQKELMNLLTQDCGSCHGLTMKGGLGPPLLPETLAGKEDGRLADIIRNGVPDTPMPPWAFEITPDEALWLVAVLRQGLVHGR